MVTRFVETIRAKFKELGYSKIESNQETGGQFLVSVVGRLYTIYEDYQVQSFPDGLCAIGCGAEYALGALWYRKLFDPKGRVELALEAAAYFSNGVSKPFVFLES